MIPRLRAIGRRIGAALLPFGIVVACASPTLPLPPPATPDIAAGEDADHVLLTSGCGGVEGNANVEVVNTNPTVPLNETGVVATATACGSWNAQVYAHAGDELSITQQAENQESTPVTVQVPQGD